MTISYAGFLELSGQICRFARTLPSRSAMCLMASWKKLFLLPWPKSVKAELERTAGVKRTIDGEGGSTEKKRGAYEKITPKNKAKITKYAAENRIAAAIRHFNKQQAFHSLKESAVRGRKKAYCEELGRRKAAEDRVPKKNVGR